MMPWAFGGASQPAMGLHCKRRHGRRENTRSCKLRPAGPACAEARPFQLLPQLRQPDARFTLQNGVQDLRLLSELQRLLLTKKFSPRRRGESVRACSQCPPTDGSKNRNRDGTLHTPPCAECRRAPSSLFRWL